MNRRSSFIWLLVSLIFLVSGSLLVLSRPRVNEQDLQLSEVNKLAVTGALHFAGAADARVTVIEFSDFQCPECKKAKAITDWLQATYGERVQFVYRHFPITPLHPHALAASNASEAAASQGKFWEYADLLLDQQNVWSEVKDPGDLFLAYGRQVGVPDLTRFQDEVRNMNYRQVVLQDLKLGNQLGVGSVPAYFVNGQKFTPKGLQLAVERILSKPQ